MRLSGPKPKEATRKARILSGMGLLLSMVALQPFVFPQQESPSNAEISSQESAAKFRIQVERNLVQVRVVVRNPQGKAVTGLIKDDFVLTDDGKLQVISHFAVENPEERAAAQKAATPPADEPESEEQQSSLPDRYIALFFDDIHAEFADLARTREAGEKYISTMLQPGDRLGIFTSSGQNQLDFTDDLGKIHQALRALLPRPVVSRRQDQCPQISDYQGYMIAYRHDPYAIEIAKEEAKLCDPNVAILAASQDASGDAVDRAATASAEFNAQQAVNEFQMETEYVLRGLRSLIRALAALPGQRTVVMVSPGFIMLTAEMQVNQLIDLALRSNVVVNALDAKGLYAPVILGDASKNPVLPVTDMKLVGNKAQLDIDRVNSLHDAMRYLAQDTGGVFFANNNDLDQGFRKVGALPEVSYTLAFSPQNMKFNGNFHKIKVTLAQKSKFTIQARRGYYAPEKPTDPTAQEKEEIAQAIFSQAEVRELPVDVQTQYFKISDTQAKLAILTHLDLSLLHFRKEDGRNFNTLTVVTVLFDRNGKYLDGKEKKMEFRLQEPTYERLAVKGITSKASFDVIPGTYVIRLVVRDSEGAQLSALNRRVEIPL
jgi:VWFA-related protein